MRLTAQIICDILKVCMGLATDQIWIYNQRMAIPEDKRLYIVVGVISMKPYGNTNKVTASTTGMSQDLNQYVSETLSIDLFSYDTEVQERYGEVLASLMSVYSQQIQEDLALKIFPIPLNVNDVSMVEGAAIINRLSLSFTVLRKYNTVMGAQYYDRITPGYISLTDH